MGDGLIARAYTVSLELHPHGLGWYHLFVLGGVHTISWVLLFRQRFYSYTG